MTGLREAVRDRLARRSPPAAAAALGSPPALPVPDGTAAPGQPDMAELVARMRAAARQAGIDDDGPLTPLLETFMLTLDRLGALTDRNARIHPVRPARLRCPPLDRETRQPAAARHRRVRPRPILHSVRVTRPTWRRW